MRTRPPELFARPHARQAPRPPLPSPVPGQMFAHIGRKEETRRRRMRPVLFLGACVVFSLAVVVAEEAFNAYHRIDAVRVVFMEADAAAAAEQIVRDGGLVPLAPEPPPDAAGPNGASAASKRSTP